MLPGSTEVSYCSPAQAQADSQRVLSVSGVADAVHIAVYYIGNILLEFNERNPGAATGLYRQQGARGGPPPLQHAGAPPGNTATMPGAQTQQIFIPNSLVGASKLLSSSSRC
jgi:poly(rC)-binding protein 2/3/4